MMRPHYYLECSIDHIFDLYNLIYCNLIMKNETPKKTIVGNPAFATKSSPENGSRPPADVIWENTRKNEHLFLDQIKLEKHMWHD